MASLPLQPILFLLHLFLPFLVLLMSLFPYIYPADRPSFFALSYLQFSLSCHFILFLPPSDRRSLCSFSVIPLISYSQQTKFLISQACWTLESFGLLLPALSHKQGKEMWDQAVCSPELGILKALLSIDRIGPFERLLMNAEVLAHETVEVRLP